MMLSASNALCRDGVAYLKLRRFSFTLNGLVTAVMAVLITPPVFNLIVRRGMGLPSDVAGLAGRSISFSSSGRGRSGSAASTRAF